jgi:ABC-type oligopeptide transport system substrate-binding subunit
MKKFLILTTFVLAGTFLLTACAPGNSSADLIYRGEVTNISDNGDILVTQAAG